jgi:hypothetical protein
VRFLLRPDDLEEIAAFDDSCFSFDDPDGWQEHRRRVSFLHRSAQEMGDLPALRLIPPLIFLASLKTDLLLSHHHRLFCSSNRSTLAVTEAALSKYFSKQDFFASKTQRR